MSKDTDFPAFPIHGTCHAYQFTGLTARDYFAAKAMAVVWQDIPDDANRADALLYLGKGCYEMADAMLKAREA